MLWHKKQSFRCCATKPFFFLWLWCDNTVTAAHRNFCSFALNDIGYLCVFAIMYGIKNLFVDDQWSISVLIFLWFCRCQWGWGFQCMPTCLKYWITTACLPLILLTHHHGQTLQCLTCQWHTTDCYWLAPLLLLAKFITGSTKVAWDGHGGWCF